MLTLILVSNILLVTSCSNETEEKQFVQKQKKMIVEKQLKEKLSYYPIGYDQSIVGLCNLFDSKSINLNVLNNYENYLTNEDKLFLVFENTYCELHIANGGSKGEFQSVKVAYQKEVDKNSLSRKVNFNNCFLTNNGIKLGMDIDEFLKVIPYKTELEKYVFKEEIRFSFFDSSMPYRANYLFKKKQLVSFDFGFSED